MELDFLKIILAILAGVITVFTPCTFPFLPVILGRSLGTFDWKKPVVILGSLAISLLIFGIVFNATLKLFGLSQSSLAFFGGIVITLFGYVTIVPESWDWLCHKLKFGAKSRELLGTGQEKKSFAGDVLIGFAMGPVFTGCSPVLLAILPLISLSGFGTGIIYLLAYIVGLVGFLALIAILGQKVTKKMGFLAQGGGVFRRNLGVLLLIIGVMIMTGGDKAFEAWLIANNIDIFTGVEGSLGDWFGKE